MVVYRVSYTRSVVVVEASWPEDSIRFPIYNKEIVDKLITDLTEARDKAFRPFSEMDG